MDVHIVIGANYGDEGKGRVTADLVKNSNGRVLNVLTNGGPQRAHSFLVQGGSDTITAQHLGAGAYFGADLYFSRYFIVNPMVFVDEYIDMHFNRYRDFDIYMSPFCKFTTPYDVLMNRAVETERGLNRHGTVGMGIWMTIDRYNKGYFMNFAQFMMSTEETQKYEMQRIRKYYETGQFPSMSGEFKRIWDNCEDKYLTQVNQMKRAVRIGNPRKKYDTVVLENGQGLLLNFEQGNDRTTPTKTGIEYAQSILEDLGIDGNDFSIDVTAHYVTRPYITRHGYGAIKGETKKDIVSNGIQEDLTNHYNVWQGEFRYADLDIQELHNRVMADAWKGLIYKEIVLDVTHCDEMDREKEFRACFENVKTYESAIV